MENSLFINRVLDGRLM